MTAAAAAAADENATVSRLFERLPPAGARHERMLRQPLPTRNTAPAVVAGSWSAAAEKTNPAAGWGSAPWSFLGVAFCRAAPIAPSLSTS